MSYSIEQFSQDHQLDPAEVGKAKHAMIEQMRLHELKEARRARNLTQRKLAERMGVSQKRVSILESGHVEHVEISTLQRYLEGIGATLHITALLPTGQTLHLM